MKKLMHKISLILSIALLSTLFISCGKQDENKVAQLDEMAGGEIVAQRFFEYNDIDMEKLELANSNSYVWPNETTIHYNLLYYDNNTNLGYMIRYDDNGQVQQYSVGNNYGEEKSLTNIYANLWVTVGEFSQDMLEFKESQGYFFLDNRFYGFNPHGEYYYNYNDNENSFSLVAYSLINEDVSISEYGGAITYIKESNKTYHYPQDFKMDGFGFKD